MHTSMRCATRMHAPRCPDGYMCTAHFCLARTRTCPRAAQECGDFKRGACFRATCKFLHGGKPASEVALLT